VELELLTPERLIIFLAAEIGDKYGLARIPEKDCPSDSDPVDASGFGPRRDP
jgi:hypothetical protein